MKKNDMLTLIGFISTILLIIWGMMAGGSSLKLFYDPPSIAITVGCSFGALLIAYPIDEIKRFMKVAAQVFKADATSDIENVTMFVNLSKKARRDGLLSLEDEIQQIENDFVKKALNMIVDGIEPESIREIMTLEIRQLEQRHEDAASMFLTWGAYAPAMGMVGTLIGLIQMLANLSDSANLASGMGKALITTFYGSVLANLVVIPIAGKLKYKTSKETNRMEMMIEGVLSIQSGVNPRIIEDKMVVYLSPKDRVKYMDDINNQGLGE
ncbi:MAG: motility protein A [Clostridium sp.]|uniref:motility protein A n=1 Tax=Clostridium sp. TaxID=1506 RepID=UPI00304FA8A8